MGSLCRDEVNSAIIYSWTITRSRAAVYNIDDGVPCLVCINNSRLPAADVALGCMGGQSFSSQNLLQHRYCADSMCASTVQHCPAAYLQLPVDHAVTVTVPTYLHMYLKSDRASQRSFLQETYNDAVLTAGCMKRLA